MFNPIPLIMEILIVILSSAVISGLVSALVSGWFNLRSKQAEYANAYYKLILDRRLAAYEEIEALIGTIKIMVVDLDQRPYHFLFAVDDGHDAVYTALSGIMSKALWLSDELFELTRVLNVLIYRKATKELGLIEFGKQHYKTIANLRVQMEKVHLKDMLTLHDAPAFLKSKRPAESYADPPPRG